MKFLPVVRMSLCILCFHVYCQAQVVFTDAPKDLQLFPRDSSNKAIVKFAGFIESSDFTRISISVKKDDDFFLHKVSSLRKDFSQPFNFQFQVDIYAQPCEYNFRVYVHNSRGDSIEVCKRERIVCGDIYVLYGQSNIVALGDVEQLYMDFDDRLLRNFDFDNGGDQISSLKWFPALQPYGSVGGIGMHLQKLILEKYGIPTCVINGGKGGLSIVALNDRQEQSPGAFWTIYGQLYNRVLHAGAFGKVKGVLWRQGEFEACGYWKDVDDYPAHFSNLYNHLKTDIGGWDKFYNIQIGIHGCNFAEKAGELREYMRKTKYLFEGIETFTALGIPMVDGFHHSSIGNKQITEELFGLIERDIYKAPNDVELHPPDIQKVYYSASDNTLTLEFEEGQQMKYPADTTINSVLWQMKDYFFVNCLTNNNNKIVESAEAKQNKVILKLNSQIDGGFLTYLPSYSIHELPKQEVHLTNSRGLRAMSFYQFPIANLLPEPLIDSVIYITEGQLKLFFESSDTTIVERKRKTDEAFIEVARISGGSFVDNLLTDDLESVSYRIKKTNQVSVSNYSSSKEYILSDCDNNQIVLSGVVNKTTTKKSRKIESSQKIRTYAKYSFKDKVELKAGFETTNNATFEVSVSGCKR